MASSRKSLPSPKFAKRIAVALSGGLDSVVLLDIAKAFDHGYYNDNNKHKLHKLKAFHCSCWMCGNPRKYFGEKTWQETKFECQAIVDERKDPISKHEWEDLNDPAMEW